MTGKARLLSLMAIISVLLMSADARPQSAATIPNVPPIVRQAEGANPPIRGLWTFTGKSGVGRWGNGAIGALTVEQFDETEVVIRRTDVEGVSPGITAVYRGTLNGSQIKGEVTWTMGSNAWKGEWAAVIGCGNGPQAVTAEEALARGEQARGNRDAIGVECWWTVAANQGSVQGKLRLGELFLHEGPGFKPDYKYALTLLHEIEPVAPEASYLLGMAYQYGRYTPQGAPDVERARSCFRQAAERGYVPAQEFCVCGDPQTSVAMKKLLMEADVDPVVIKTKIAAALELNLRLSQTDPETFDIGPPVEHSPTIFLCTASFKTHRNVKEFTDDPETKAFILTMKTVLPPEVWSMPFIQSFVVTRTREPGNYIVSLGKIGHLGSIFEPMSLSKTYAETISDISCKPRVTKPPACEFPDQATAIRGKDVSKSPPEASIEKVGPTAPDSSCASEGNLKSLRSDEVVNVTIQNNSSETLKVFWIDFAGRRDFRRTIAPGVSFVQPTFATHPWILADLNGRCRKLVVVDRSTHEINAKDRPVFGR